MSWLHDLVRDVLWAKAYVLIVGGWKTRPAWRYVRFVKGQIPIPEELSKRARGHYRVPFVVGSDST